MNKIIPDNRKMISTNNTEKQPFITIPWVLRARNGVQSRIYKDLGSEKGEKQLNPQAAWLVESQKRIAT